MTVLTRRQFPLQSKSMMNIERPDLDKLDPAVRTYIEALEAELAKDEKLKL